MKSRSFVPLAIAVAFAASSGAMAGGASHRVEVSTPSSVSESAPWLAGKPHLAGWSASGSTMALSMSRDLSTPQNGFAMGASAGMSGSGSGGFDSFDVAEGKEYWLVGDESSGTDSAVGRSSSLGGSGSVGFDSSMSSSTSHNAASNPAPAGEIVVYTPDAEMILSSLGEESPLLSEHYLVMQPLSSFDGSSFVVLAIGPTSEDLALLDSLRQDFFVLTPVYDEG